MAPPSNKEFLDIQVTIQCKFTLKLVIDKIITYIQHTASVLAAAVLFTLLFNFLDSKIFEHIS